MKRIEICFLPKCWYKPRITLRMFKICLCSLTQNRSTMWFTWVKLSSALLLMKLNHTEIIGLNKGLQNRANCRLLNDSGNSERIRFHPWILAFSIKGLIKTSQFVWWQSINASLPTILEINQSAEKLIETIVAHKNIFQLPVIFCLATQY